MCNKNYKRQIRIKLIFDQDLNTNSNNETQAMNVINEIRDWSFVPELHFMSEYTDLRQMVLDAIMRGIRMFVVCGGDEAVLNVSKAMTGTNATLGIIPAGRQNNLALSLGIPVDTAGAVSILRKKRRIKADMGGVACGEMTTPFNRNMISMIDLSSLNFEKTRAI